MQTTEKYHWQKDFEVGQTHLQTSTSTGSLLFGGDPGGQFGLEISWHFVEDFGRAGWQICSL